MGKNNKNTTLNWAEFQALGDPNYVPEPEEKSEEMPRDYSKQVLRIVIEKKGRGGKSVSIVTGLKVGGTEIKQFAQDLKKICGVGGSVKGTEIIIQGDKRDKIIDYFQKLGVKDIKKSGG